jgi:hypothetical protein
MKNWTDPCINWHQLGSTELRRLIATWGMDAKAIARYDAKHGHAPAPVAADVPAKPVKKTATKTEPRRQKHTGADGEIKFLQHRDLYIGFWGGRVVVTKRTKEACRMFLATEFGAE